MTHRETSMTSSFIAGCVGGISGLVVSYPFDTLKVRIQTHPGHYSSAVHCFKSMVKKEGAMSLYRGVLAPAVGYGAINSVAFGVNNAFMRQKPNGWDVWPMVAGFAAGLSSGFVRAPVERVKTVMQHSIASRAPYPSSFHCAIDLVRSHGFVKGIMPGVVSTVIREACQYAVYFPIFLYSKHAMVKVLGANSIDELPPIAIAGAGAIAGAAQWLPPLYSLDVIKSRVQAAPHGTYDGIIDCARSCYKEGGMRIFVTGLAPSLMRAIPLHATIFLVYDRVLKILGPA